MSAKEMNYKKFKEWCNERATDGNWSCKTAQYCITLMDLINAYPFWKREKIWKKEYKKSIIENVINPIEELRWK